MKVTRPRQTLLDNWCVKGCYIVGRLVGVDLSTFCMTGCSPCMQEVEGSIPTGGTCPSDFSDPIDQDICTQRALSWKIVVSEWRSAIAVSLNVGGGVRLIKPAKLYMCMQNTIKHNEDGRTAPGVCGNGSVPLSHSGNVVTRIGIHTHVQHACTSFIFYKFWMSPFDWYSGLRRMQKNHQSCAW